MTFEHSTIVDNNVRRKIDEQTYIADDTVAEAKTSIVKSDGSVLQAENSIIKGENSILNAENSILKADSSTSVTKVHEADSEAFETSATDFELPYENHSPEDNTLQKFILKTTSEVVRASDSDGNTVAVDQADPSTPSPVRTPCGVSEGDTSAKGNPHRVEGGSGKGMKQSTVMLMSPEMQEQLLFHQMLTPHNLQLFQHQRNLLLKQNQVHILNYPSSFFYLYSTSFFPS